MNGWVYRPTFGDYSALNIHLVGCGGTGARVLAPLMKAIPRRFIGINLNLWDGDQVEERNLLRQNFAPEDVGLNKAKVLAERLAGLDDRFSVGCHPMADAATLFGDSNYTPTIILGCTDSPEFRQEMNACVNVSAPDTYRNPTLLWLDAGNERVTGQVVINGWCFGEVNNLISGDRAGRDGFAIRFRGLAEYFPALVDGSKDPFDQGCAQRLDIQTTAVNQLAASWMICLLSNLLVGKKTNCVGVTFSTDGDSQRLVMSEEPVVDAYRGIITI